MAIKNFILQGFTPQTHLQAVNRLFEVPNIERVILSIAFVNEDGVRLIEDRLRTVADRTTVLAGIRNDITSRQGLARLLNLRASVYAVDTGARTTVFHTKVFLVKGRTVAGLVIGSANLTLGGLNNNIEAGLALDLDLSVPQDRELVENIERQLLALPTQDPQHVLLISAETQLLELQNSGRLLDESEALAPRPVITGSAPAADRIPRIQLQVPAIHPTVRRATRQPAVDRQPQGRAGSSTPPKTEVATNLELVWRSKLTERDLNIPQSPRTNATGGPNLDRGLLEAGVDHRHYFRDDVFAHLNWQPGSSATVEEAQAQFQLIIKGVFYGEFTLRIAHTTSTDTPSYHQRNAMTRLSWGGMREYIAQRDFIGRTLSLYRDETQPTRFVLEID